MLLIDKQLQNKLKYFAWCMRESLKFDTSCAACRCLHTRSLKRKKIVTALYECTTCGLRFRVPKDNLSTNIAVYQENYLDGVSGNMPSDAELNKFLTTGDTGQPPHWGGNYHPYILVLKASGLGDGACVLDFGASWGYGSYQLQEAGFKVMAYEISQPRARYAFEK